MCTSVGRAAAELLILPIKFYRRFISPLKPGCCRFTPTCSQYAMDALRTHGPVKGLLLGAWRIARCHPLGKWGFDPVPEKGRWKSARARLNPPALKKGRK